MSCASVRILLLSLLLLVFVGGKSDLRSKLGEVDRSALSYPDIFIIGAQKSATSSLYEVLVSSPDICAEGEKEKHFFDSPEFYSDTGLENYYAQFIDCRYRQFTVDASPRYIQVAGTAERIVKSYRPHTLATKKFILLLRSPAARLFSEYQDFVRKCLETGYFEANSNPYSRHGRVSDYHRARGTEHCNQTMKNYIPGMRYDQNKLYSFASWVNASFGIGEFSRGLYVNHINEWLQSGISRSQLLILSFQSLVILNTKDTMHRVASFLSLKHDGGMSDLQVLPQAHPQQHFPFVIMDCPTIKRLEAMYEPSNVNLYKLLSSPTLKRPSMEPPFPPFDSAQSICK
jgi:hypothetical protein